MVIVVVIVLGFRLDPRMSPPRATRRTPMMPRLACASCAPLGGGYRPDPSRLVKLSFCRACSQTFYNGAWQFAVCTVDDVQSMTTSEYALAIAVTVETASYHDVMLGNR